MIQRKREILVVIRNGLVRPHSVNTHALVMKKITFFTGSDKKWFGKTTFSKHTCISYEENHLFYKCESYKAMTGKEKMKFVKSQNLSFNCLKRDHRAEKCPSKNRCLHPECAETHHTSLHDYFKKKVEATTAV